MLHIQQGTENGTYNWFNNPAARVSTHFGNPRSGKMEQFVSLADLAWAQGTGNAHWFSAENEGSVPQALTDSQMGNIAVLLEWLHENYDVPLKLADSPSDFGLGHHSMGGDHWGHPQCPGAAIIQQRAEIVSRVGTRGAHGTFRPADTRMAYPHSSGGHGTFRPGDTRVGNR